MERRLPLFLGILIGLSALAGGASIFAQHGYGIVPCAYCKVQRGLYLLLIPLGILAFWLRSLLWVIRGVLMTGLVTALLQVAKVFGGETCGCTKAGSWEIFGLPAAVYSAGIFLILFIGTFWAKRGPSKAR